MSSRKPREPAVASNEARIVRLETVIENIFSILTRMDKRFDSIETRMDSADARMDKRFDSLETRMENRFNSLESDMKQGFKEVDERCKAIDGRFKDIDTRFKSVEDRQWSNFLWLMSMMIGLAGLMLTLAIGLASLIAHCQHWI